LFLTWEALKVPSAVVREICFHGIQLAFAKKRTEVKGNFVSTKMKECIKNIFGELYKIQFLHIFIGLSAGTKEWY